jgi:hypothetical protein
MTSVSTDFKQSRGYFVATATTTFSAYVFSTVPSGAGGSFSAGVLTAATLTPVVGDIFRDMGKTVTVGSVGSTGTTAASVAGLGPRVFRKVQYVNKGRAQATSTVNPSNGIGSGAGATDVLATTAGTGYNTFYIELPAPGSQAGTVPNLVYVPGLPGLFV